MICLSQLLVSKIHNFVFSLRNKIIDKLCDPPNFYLPTHENFAMPYTSLDLAHNLLSDWLLAPLFVVVAVLLIHVEEEWMKSFTQCSGTIPCIID